MMYEYVRNCTSPHNSNYVVLFIVHNSNYVVHGTRRSALLQAGILMEKTAAETPCIMTPESISAYIQYEVRRGASANALRNCRKVTKAVYEWLPEEKTLTKERLLAWRQSLKEHGYSPDTELNYVKGINRYLDHIGRPDLRFNRGRAKDIAGKQFGYLTAIEPTGEKYRKDIVWRCRCKCGREVSFPATRLLTGNTLSCGCLKGEYFKTANKYFDGTSLRQSIEEKVYSTKAASGYTGVTPKRDKWKAYIRYKGKCISLGCYARLEDAVKARARGKELVRMDALGLLDFYEELHRDDPARPTRQQIRQMQNTPQPEPPAGQKGRALHSNNTSGCPGVHQARGKWVARITSQKVTYQLGAFAAVEDAIAARQAAERLLEADPQQFQKKYGNTERD